MTLIFYYRKSVKTIIFRNFESLEKSIKNLQIWQQSKALFFLLRKISANAKLFSVDVIFTYLIFCFLCFVFDFIFIFLVKASYYFFLSSFYIFPVFLTSTKKNYV